MEIVQGAPSTRAIRPLLPPPSVDHGQYRVEGVGGRSLQDSIPLILAKFSPITPNSKQTTKSFAYSGNPA